MEKPTSFVLTIVLLIGAIFLLPLAIANYRAVCVDPHQIRYETVQKFDNIGDHGTLFIDKEGNLFTLDAVYPEKPGSEFILKIDGHGTKTVEDDSIEEVFIHPQPIFEKGE